MNKYTAKETAKELGINYCTLLERVRAGLYPCHKLSVRKIFFTAEDIAEIYKSSAVPAKEANRG